MSGGFGIAPAGMEQVAATLSDAVTTLEGAATAPPAPDVGDMSGPVAAALSLLADQAAAVSEAMTSVADAVRSSQAAYDTTDADVAGVLGDASPAPGAGTTR